MTPQTLSRFAVTLALTPILFTLATWLWIFTRPPGAFHDQGGLAITIYYFPATFVVWFLCALSSIILVIRVKGDATAPRNPIAKLRWLVAGLVVLGLFLSAGTLFIA